MAEQHLQGSACGIRITAAQAVALNHLLALLRQDAEITSTGEPIHWLHVTTQAQTWLISADGKVQGWNDRPEETER